MTPTRSRRYSFAAATRCRCCFRHGPASTEARRPLGKPFRGPPGTTIAATHATKAPFSAWPLAADKSCDSAGRQRAARVTQGELSACFNPDTLQFEAACGQADFSRSIRHDMGSSGQRSPAGPPDRKATRRGTAAWAADLPRLLSPRPTHDGLFLLHRRRAPISTCPWVKDGGLVREIAPAASHPLAHLLKGGPPQWPQVLHRQGHARHRQPLRRRHDHAPPSTTRGDRCMFFGGHGFFSNGDAAICTMQGDVWRVSGLDARV
jgi:hypothetical protein